MKKLALILCLFLPSCVTQGPFAKRITPLGNGAMQVEWVSLRWNAFFSSLSEINHHTTIVRIVPLATWMKLQKLGQ